MTAVIKVQAKTLKLDHR